jgi:hypothetical protein
VQSLLKARCQLCHGSPPLMGVPGALTSYDDFLRPAKSTPGMTMADVVVTRVTTAMAMLRMPPVPAAPLTAVEIQTLNTWIEAGMPLEGCVAGPGTGSSDGGAPAPADAGPDPFAVAPKCTSGVTWTRGDNGSASMQPGEACVACHAKGEGPRLAFGGTLYPSAHEPSQCYGVDGVRTAQGATVVVIDSAGTSVTAQVNAAGNFYVSARTALVPPLRAKVVFMGRERIMIGAVPNGDCNTCHTQQGTTTLKTMGALPAPGRIILP